MKNTTPPKLVLSELVLPTKLRDLKDHFAVTVYKDVRKKLAISKGTLLLLNVDGYELIRQVYPDFHITLPKRLLNYQKYGDEIVLPILKIIKPEECERRPMNAFLENKLDIRYFIPTKTVNSIPLHIIERNHATSSIWYSVAGGVQHVTLQHFADIVKVAEFLGFYFGDGTTCDGIQSFILTNCESSILNHCIDFCEEVGIKRTLWKVQVIYSTNNELTPEIKQRCTEYWSKVLKLEEEKIVSVTKSKSQNESYPHGSARIFIDNTILVEIFLRCLLKGVIQHIFNPQETEDYQLMEGFMRGLLAAEGCVLLNKNGSVVRVSIAFDPHSSELEFYKVLLQNLGIRYHAVRNNELIIQKYENMQKLYRMEAFKLHSERHKKFITGFKNHKFFKYCELV